MIYKVGIAGASGRVGSEVAALLGPGYRRGEDLLELADAVTGSGKLTRIEGVDARKFGEPPREPVHVWIDFSRPEGTMRLLEEADAPVVIGTTGLTEAQLGRIREYASRHAVLLAPNTSPGLNALAALLRRLPRSDRWDFQVVVSEDHHRHKKDAPSGTAKKLLGILGERGYADPPVHVTRAGGIIGVHTVRLISDREELVFTHRVTDRRVFAEGALAAAAFLARGVPPRLYGMEDVFEGSDT